MKRYRYYIHMYTRMGNIYVIMWVVPQALHKTSVMFENLDAS